jgi:hypothetical protein
MFGILFQINAMRQGVAEMASLPASAEREQGVYNEEMSGRA